MSDREFEPHELDDGASEVVEKSPARRPPTTRELSDAANAPADRMAAMRAAGERQRSEFILYRGPEGATKFAVAHGPVLAALWRVWSRKRVGGESDPGVSFAEIETEIGGELPWVRHVVATLVRNNLIRSVRFHVGWQGNRALYYPTEAAVRVLALAQTFPMGSSVQIGSTKLAFKLRSAAEPMNLFEVAKLMRAGVDPAEYTAEST